MSGPVYFVSVYDIGDTRQNLMSHILTHNYQLPTGITL